MASEVIYLPCFGALFHVKDFPADTDSFVRVSLEEVEAVGFNGIWLWIVGTGERPFLLPHTVEMMFTAQSCK